MLGLKRLGIATLMAAAAMTAVVGAQSTVMMSINPDIRRISLDTGPKEIKITALAGGKDLTFDWRLKGPGQLAGDSGDAAISYIPPDNMPQSTGEASVILTIGAREGRAGQGRVDFILIDPTPEPLDTGPQPEPDNVIAEVKTKSEKPPAPQPSESQQSAAQEPEQQKAVQPKPQTAQPQTVEQLLARAADRERNAQFAAPEKDSAFADYRAILEKHPNHPVALQKLRTMVATIKSLGDQALKENDYAEAQSLYEQYLTIQPFAEGLDLDPMLSVERREVDDRLSIAGNLLDIQRLEALRPDVKARLETYQALRDRENQGENVMGPIILQLETVIANLKEIQSIYGRLAESRPMVAEKANRVAKTLDQLENELEIRRARGFDGSAEGLQEATP